MSCTHTLPLDRHPRASDPRYRRRQPGRLAGGLPSLEWCERPLHELGRGDFGVVYAKPYQPDRVLKLLITGDITRSESGTHYDREYYTAQLLAAHQLGPQLYDVFAVDGYAVLEKERVFGETVAGLCRMRRFGEAEAALTRGLVDRLANFGETFADLYADNIMLGTTARQPERRAYIVDCNASIPLSAGSHAQRVNAILDWPVAKETFVHRDIGVVERVITLRGIINRGVYQSARRPWWQFGLLHLFG